MCSWVLVVQRVVAEHWAVAQQDDRPHAPKHESEGSATAPSKEVADSKRLTDPALPGAYGGRERLSLAACLFYTQW